MSNLLMKNGKVVGVGRGYEGEMNKDILIEDKCKERSWKIEYNEFGLKSEADALSTELSTFTGLNKSIFPTTIGLPRKNDLKVWYGEQLLWDYTQEQELPSARKLMCQIGLIEKYNWRVQKHI